MLLHVLPVEYNAGEYNAGEWVSQLYFVAVGFEFKDFFCRRLAAKQS